MRLFVPIVFMVWLVLAALSASLFRDPIEVELHRRVRHALDARGLGMVQVEVDHLDVKLSGNVPVPEMRSAATEVLGGVGVVRLVENRITFGRDPVPKLVFAAGDPVRVSGLIAAGQESDALGFGDGFDTAGIELGARAEIPFINRLVPFVKRFFREVSDGRLELDGQRLMIEGELPNRLVKWRIVDEAMGMSVGMDLVDRLRVRPPRPFAIDLQVDGDRLQMRGVVRDEASLLAVGGGSPGADCSGVSIDPEVGTPAWLWRVADPLMACSRMAISASFELSPQRLSAAATFANQFWLEAATRRLRAALPGQPELELNFQVARPAVALEGAPAAAPPEPPLPIEVFIARDRLRVEGRVRSREERASIISKFGRARPDLMIQNALRLDPRADRLPAVRQVLPDFLAYAVSGVAESGSLELGASRWRFSAQVRDPEFVRFATRVGSGLGRYSGIPIDLDLRLVDGEMLPGVELALADYSVYFRDGGAQIISGQGEKVSALAELIAGLKVGVEVVLTGFDRGDGRLALQRARAVRRELLQAGGLGGRILIRAAAADPGLGWRTDRVSVGLGQAPDGV